VRRKFEEKDGRVIVRGFFLADERSVLRRPLAFRDRPWRFQSAAFEMGFQQGFAWRGDGGLDVRVLGGEGIGAGEGEQDEGCS